MNLPKTLFLSFLLSLALFGLLLVKVVFAQIPPGKVGCDKTRKPEFHSLRPYQANPCDDEVSETALFCGNSLVISDEVVAYQRTPPALDEDCTPIGNNRYRCTYQRKNSRSINIDLRSANLPIMGSTETKLVVNSQEQPDPEGLDDAEKVNEYVSWYLNGVTNRAEYPYPDTENEEDARKIIDFSGPLRKLLPWDIQTRERVRTIEKATKSSDDLDKDKRKEGQNRHDQIVGCVYNFFGGLKKGQIVECYPDKSSISEVRLSDWKKHLPPLRENYDDFKDYWIAYKRWRGESCLKLPIFDLPICIDSPLKPNYWGNLFANIPFSSTEDRRGLVETDRFGLQPASEDITITNVSFDNQEPAELFFAHMQETSELTELLQKTFVSKDESTTGPVTGVSPGESCDLVNIRTNSGDDLFAGEIGGTLSYNAEFSCNFDSTATESACRKKILVNLSVISKTPKADDVWSRTVAGPSSIFKRIFPKVGPGGAILGILDIPAATKVSYVGADFAGNPGNQRSGEGAELYFPHIGGVSEYFLKGIQTILRPKGFGEPILSGQAIPGGGKQCSYSDGAIDTAIQKAASKYNVPASLLRAIFEIEGLDYLADPKNYVCMENAAGAAGLMQITRSTYNIITCENERLDNDLGICTDDTNKLSRCDIDDVFELAARTLLWKAGKWVYGPGNCRATGGISASNKQEIYDASCRYYGSYSPDSLTINYSQSIPTSKRKPGGDMNYCDIVCYKMGLCPPYP